jgi:hypothetical protein
MVKLQQTTRVSKRHVKNTMRDVMLDRKFLFLVKRGHQRMLKALDMVSKDVGVAKMLGTCPCS